MLQLLISSIVLEGQDGDAVLHLQPEGVDIIVDNHHVLGIFLKNSQILDITALTC